MLRIHRLFALLIGVVTALVAGCASSLPARPASVFNRFNPVQAPAGPDIIEMQVALLERPLGDTFLGPELWKEVDEQTLSMQRKVVLEENGFRVGQVGGLTPAGLHRLLTSVHSNANPRRMFVHLGKPSSIVLGPAMPLCRFECTQDGVLTPVTLDLAECRLNVVPQLADEGRIRLAFTPQVRHGQAQPVPHPLDDHSGFILRSEQPTESYASMSWEVTLAPNQYVLVGAQMEHPRGLGYQCFIRFSEPAPVQRLLVMRVSRTVGDLPPNDLFESDEPESRKPMPLVVQAAWSAPAPR
jgi:hypothetical protein